MVFYIHKSLRTEAHRDTFRVGLGAGIACVGEAYGVINVSIGTRKFRRAEERRRAKDMARASKEAQQGASWEFQEQGGSSGDLPGEDTPAAELVGLGEGQRLPRLARTADIARMFSVHAKTVERWRKLDGLPCLRIRGTVRYDLSDVLRWASARKEGV